MPSVLLYHASRIILGAIFLYASFDKILHPQAFAEAVYNYQILPDSTINLTAIVLPWLEALLGICLLAGVWMPGVSVISTGLLGFFIGALIFNQVRGIDVHCGCFSTQSSGDPAGMLWTVARDALFLFFSVYLTVWVFFWHPAARLLPGKQRLKILWRSCLRNTSLILIAVFYAFIFPATSAADENVRALFSHGAGPTEIMLFTDYFCPPCRKIEPYLENALEALHRLNVKITFVDKPIHSITPLFSRYFLYSSKAAGSFADILRARSALFAIAETHTVDSERGLLQALKEKKIAYVLMDTSPAFDQWSQLSRQYEVRSTPTCIVLKPGQQEIRYTGSLDIPAGIDMLIKELTPDI